MALTSSGAGYSRDSLGQSGSSAAPLKLLVEHCTAERDERPQPSMSLKGDKASYTNKLQELVQIMQLELPDVEILANTSHLFRVLDDMQHRSLGHDYHKPTHHAGKGRGPRLGSFELFLELSIWDGLKGTEVAMLVPLTSKLQSKKFPDIRRVPKRVLDTVLDNVQHLALKSIEGQQRAFIYQLIDSSLQYNFTRQLDLMSPEEAPTAHGVDRWGEALQLETWELASVRELEILPQMLMRSKSWRFLRQILCSLHFLAAKIRKCGLKAVVCDLEAAQALVNQSTSATYQTSEHGVESKHLSTAALSLQRQLSFDVGTCLRFVTKNGAVLSAKPDSIYAHAQRYSFPGLMPLKQRFVVLFQHLEILAKVIDKDDRESTGIELLKLAYGVSMTKWAKRSGFMSTFSETDGRWMDYCCEDFQARIMVRKQWIRQTLAVDANAARAIFTVAPDDDIVGHFSPARLFHVLTRAVAIEEFDATMRLEFQSQEKISAEQGFTTVQSVLHEVLSDQHIFSVETDLLRNTEELSVSRATSNFVYTVTIGLRASAIAQAQATRQTLPRTKLESVVSFLRSIFEGQGPVSRVLLCEFGRAAARRTAPNLPSLG